MVADRRRGWALVPIATTALLSITVLLLDQIKMPVVHADAVDSTFLSALNDKGIQFASAQSAVLAGHEVCNVLDGGRPKGDVVSEVMQSTQLDGYHAGFFVGLSVSAFCPRHHGG